MPLRAHRLVLLVALSALMGGCSRHAQTAATDAMDETAAAPTSASAGRGAALFVKNCESCHGTATSSGPVGPWLHGIKTRKDLDAVEAIIRHPDPPMPKLFPGTLSAQDVADLAAYVETL